MNELKGLLTFTFIASISTLELFLVSTINLATSPDVYALLSNLSINTMVIIHWLHCQLSYC